MQYRFIIVSMSIAFWFYHLPEVFFLESCLDLRMLKLILFYNFYENGHLIFSVINILLLTVEQKRLYEQCFYFKLKKRGLTMSSLWYYRCRKGKLLKNNTKKRTYDIPYALLASFICSNESSFTEFIVQISSVSYKCSCLNLSLRSTISIHLDWCEPFVNHL